MRGPGGACRPVVLTRRAHPYWRRAGPDISPNSDIRTFDREGNAGSLQRLYELVARGGGGGKHKCAAMRAGFADTADIHPFECPKRAQMIVPLIVPGAVVWMGTMQVLGSPFRYATTEVLLAAMSSSHFVSFMAEVSPVASRNRMWARELSARSFMVPHLWSCPPNEMRISCRRSWFRSHKPTLPLCGLKEYRARAELWPTPACRLHARVRPPPIPIL